MNWIYEHYYLFTLMVVVGIWTVGKIVNNVISQKKKIVKTVVCEEKVASPVSQVSQQRDSDPHPFGYYS